jgi:hypothetical protein
MEGMKLFSFFLGGGGEVEVLRPKNTVDLFVAENWLKKKKSQRSKEM